MSEEPENTLPSSSTARAVTELVCPHSVRRVAPVRPHHTLIVPSVPDGRCDDGGRAVNAVSGAVVVAVHLLVVVTVDGGGGGVGVEGGGGCRGSR